MFDDPLYLDGYFVIGATSLLDRSLEDDDLVRQGQIVAPGTPGMRHTLVETQKRHSAAHSGELGAIGPVLDYYVNVLELVEELLRQVLDSSGYQFLESLPFHDFSIGGPTALAEVPIIADGQEA